MPVGVLINAAAIVLGGLIGGFLSKRKDIKSKDKIMTVLGVAAMCMGVVNVVKINSMPAVILAILVGTVIGEAIKLEKAVSGGLTKALSRFIPKDASKEYKDKLLIMTVLACASGTGIYGALLAGMTGDNSILFLKAVLDFFTAMIFALSVSYVISFLGIALLIVLGAVYFSASLIMPILSQTMINDFIACGGIILVATGIKVAGIKNISIMNMVPALVLVMPISYLSSLVF